MECLKQVKTKQKSRKQDFQTFLNLKAQLK